MPNPSKKVPNKSGKAMAINNQAGFPGTQQLDICPTSRDYLMHIINCQIPLPLEDSMACRQIPSDSLLGQP